MIEFLLNVICLSMFEAKLWVCGCLFAVCEVAIEAEIERGIEKQRDS